MKRTVLILLVVLICGTLLFGAGGKEAAAKKVYNIGAAPYGLQAEYMRLWTTALERHPDVVSGLVKLTVFDGKYDASVQQSQFETMATQGYDGALFVPIDIEAGAAAVATAKAAGMPVVGSNTRVNSDDLLSYVGSDDVLAGYMEAISVIEAIGGKGNVVIIEGPIGQSAQIERLEGNKKALAEYPAVKVIAQRTANWSRAEALSLMENWLNAYPGQIDGVIGQNDEMALGAIQAIEQAGLNVKNFGMAGIDGVTDAMLAVKEDKMVSILQDATAQAQGALDVLLAELIGPSFVPKADVWNHLDFNGGKEKIYNVPWVPITLDNVDALLAERGVLTQR
ncbi:MAG: substrate-binding domain-containing protein [Sphaerochaetaceae bacterium]